MYFYVDESGQTGSNLFDTSQPVLYYGLLSSKLNLDVLAKQQLKQLRDKLGIERLHASELGNDGLSKIVPELLKLIKEYRLSFDFFSIVKADHAAICFFDQVFDQCINPAVSWSGYWTPLRYVLLLKVSFLFDDDTLKMAWSARNEPNDKKAETELINICRILKDRINNLPDERSQQLIGDALQWAIDNPGKIGYNTKSEGKFLQISPNLIGFQSVMFGIASRIVKHNRQASKIVVDQQLQFNSAQKTLADFYATAQRDVYYSFLKTGLPNTSLKGMPSVPLTFTVGQDSPGLDLVDIFLWVFRRKIEKKPLAPELLLVIRSLFHRCSTEEISIEAIQERWTKWFENLPEPTEEGFERAKIIREIDAKRRLNALKK